MIGVELPNYTDVNGMGVRREGMEWGGAGGKSRITPEEAYIYNIVAGIHFLSAASTKTALDAAGRVLDRQKFGDIFCLYPINLTI